MRFPRKHTMSKRADFQKVRETGRSSAGRFVVLSTLEDHSLPHTMWAFITTRKAGKAHDRVLIRRRFRAILQKHLAQVADPLRYIVVIARYNTIQASFEDLEKDWYRQAKRLKIIAPVADLTSP